MTDALSAAIESILRTDDLSEEIHQAQINTLRDAYDAASAQPAPPIGKASTDVGVPVYVVKKAEPVQEPVAWRYSVQPQVLGASYWAFSETKDVPDAQPLYTAPPQRKPPATIDEMFDRMDKAPKGVFFGHDPMTIWMEAWRAAEQQHGIK